MTLLSKTKEGIAKPDYIVKKFLAGFFEKKPKKLLKSPEVHAF